MVSGVSSASSSAGFRNQTGSGTVDVDIEKSDLSNTIRNIELTKEILKQQLNTGQSIDTFA